MEEKKLPGDIVAAFDQAVTQSENVARLVAGYYHNLIRENCPNELAYLLTEEFNRVLWSVLDRTAH